MAHSYHSILIHCVFSTKDRRPLISEELQDRLFAYIGGVAKANEIRALAIGGVSDHIHLLLSVPATMPIAKAIQLIKGGSSKWIHESFPQHAHFGWQEGYGAFSIGVAQVERTRRYIERQAEHHRTVGFQEEFLQFLTRHGIEYDPRHVWGSLSRPSGTGINAAYRFPTLKRGAIVGRPSGTGLIAACRFLTLKRGAIVGRPSGTGGTRSEVMPKVD